MVTRWAIVFQLRIASGLAGVASLAEFAGPVGLDCAIKVAGKETIKSITHINNSTRFFMFASSWH
jgi:hypothetical protein